MSVRLIEGQKPFTGGAGIEIDANKVISLLLREENNLIMINDNDEAYVDLQFEGGLTPNSDFPVGVTVGKVLAENGWEQNGLVINRKTTSGDYARWIYAADGKIFFDNGTGTWKRVYYSEEVDAAFQPLLTAGPGISIVNNIISATGGGGGGGSGKIDFFVITDDTDITNAQLAYNFYIGGGLPIVNYGQVLYAPQADTASLFSLGSISANGFVSEEDDVHGVTTTTIAKLNFSLSNGIVTGITEGDMVMSSPFLETNYNYPNTYQPLYDGSPTTKKYVDDKFSTLMGLGKFLSLWDSTTGLPISFPLTIPYTYHTGDYFMIETVASGGGTNYRPSGSSYTGTASSTTESEAVQKGDFYIYDGTVWLFASNHGGSVSFSNIAGQPTDNANLAAALNSKQNKLIASTDLSIIPGTEPTESDIIMFTNESRYIKNTATGEGSVTIQSGNPAPGNNGVNIGPGSYAAGYSVGIGSSAYSNGGYSIAIGSNTNSSNTSSIAIGRGAKAQALNSLSIGRDSSTSAINGIAIGKDAKNSSAYAIQLGKGTISGASNEYQFYVGFDGINQNYKMLDGNTGKIPNDRLHDEVLVTVGSTEPATPATGKLWYDTTNSVLKLYDGSARQTI